MAGYPAFGIVSITAKLMVILDSILGAFVNLSTFYEPAISDCGIVAINANLTACGQSLVDQLVTLVYYLVQLGGTLLPALSPVVGGAGT